VWVILVTFVSRKKGQKSLEVRTEYMDRFALRRLSENPEIQN
jgi:hypothetical protein